MIRVTVYSKIDYDEMYDLWFMDEFKLEQGGKGKDQYFSLSGTVHSGEQIDMKFTKEDWAFQVKDVRFSNDDDYLYLRK